MHAEASAQPVSLDAEKQDVVVVAEKDGKRVVVLRRYDGARGAVVECDVYPVDTMRVEPVRPGPYLFEGSEPATRFVDDLLLSLEYLGCTIS